MIRHSAEHVLADAVKRLWPGHPHRRRPPGPLREVPVRLPLRRARSRPRTSSGSRRRWGGSSPRTSPFERAEVDPRRGARAHARRAARRSSSIRLEDIPEGETITLYRHGEFVDLCRGPHVQRTVADRCRSSCSRRPGAYFKGDERNEMLQRIYGTAFATAEELDAYFARLEEARRRDHRRLGRSSTCSRSTPRRRRARSSTPAGRSSTTSSSS